MSKTVNYIYENRQNIGSQEQDIDILVKIVVIYRNLVLSYQNEIVE